MNFLIKLLHFFTNSLDYLKQLIFGVDYYSELVKHENLLFIKLLIIFRGDLFASHFYFAKNK